MQTWALIPKWMIKLESVADLITLGTSDYDELFTTNKTHINIMKLYVSTFHQSIGRYINDISQFFLYNTINVFFYEWSSLISICDSPVISFLIWMSSGILVVCFADLELMWDDANDTNDATVLVL